jgi:hypothetical protein
MCGTKEPEDAHMKLHGISEVCNYRLNVILKPHGISEVRNYRLNVILKPQLH